MSDTKHTPGPWTAKANPNDWGWDFPNVQDAKNCRPICHVPDWDKPEGEANWARIVACVNACEGINPEAVPDMLAALEATQKVLAEQWVQHHPLNNQIRAAIAKARGGA